MDAVRSPRRSKEKYAPKVSVSPLAPLPALSFFLFHRVETFLLAVAAAALHECAHIAVIYLCGGRVASIRIEPFGGQIVTEREASSYLDAILISCAGIAINLVCALPLLIPEIPRTLSVFSSASLGLALINCLPVRGLDGGEILRDLLLLFCMPERVETIIRIVSCLCLCALVVLFCRCALKYRFNPSLWLVGAYLLLSLP